MIRIITPTIVVIGLFVGQDALADFPDVVQPPAPAGYWRDDPRDPLLRRVPSAVGIADEEEARCSATWGTMFVYPYSQSKYDECIRVTVAAKRRKAETAHEDDATCKSYGLNFGTAAYAECRAHLVDRREDAARALIMPPSR